MSLPFLPHTNLEAILGIVFALLEILLLRHLIKRGLI